MHAIRLIWGISHVPSIHGLRPAKPQSEAFTGLRPARLQSEAFTGLRPARLQSEAFTGLRPARLQSEAFTGLRSEEHTSELQSLMRISYAVFCLKKKKQQPKHNCHLQEIQSA